VKNKERVKEGKEMKGEERKEKGWKMIKNTRGTQRQLIGRRKNER
jgi:hypothetical protein